MNKPSALELNAEISRLRSLVPVGTFARTTQETIDVMIEELRVGVDQTADEWDELTPNQQEAVDDARRWKDGKTSIRPSESFGGLVKELAP